MESYILKDSFEECVGIVEKSFYSWWECRSKYSPFISYYVDDGLVKKSIFRVPRYCGGHSVGELRRKCVEKKRTFSMEYCGDEEYLLHLSNEFVSGFIERCIGKDIQCVKKEIDGYIGKRTDRYLENVRATQRWLSFKEKYGPVVIGIDGSIDVYPTGFSVRVLFNSDEQFEDRKKFVKEHKKEFLNYVIGELEDKKGLMKRIGSLQYYTPTLITVLRKSAEVDVKFEVKNIEAFESL